MPLANKSSVTAVSLFALFLSPVYASETKPTLRLPDTVAPTSYRVELTLDPAKETFSGQISIRIDIKKPVGTIWLNANGISVSEASLQISDKTMAAKASQGGDDFLSLDFPSQINVGSGELNIHYTGKVRLKDSSGVFRMEDNGNKYIFTQFESTDARGAFPCFDEPSYKVPWQLTLTIPPSDSAISNTPIAKETTNGSGKTYVFRQTKPLPSYLVAFAVGPLEYVEAGTAGVNKAPVRIVVPKGHATEAKYAAEVTATILTRLEDYFGIPFPYEKSDQVAIPTTFGFGAMENAGMVTYGQTILLADPARDTVDRQREYVSTAAHELAHQWFGDLVTTAWWNDIWLNEAFATWMEQKLVAEWKPEWNTRVEDVSSKLFAEREDSLVTARKIRQEIKTKDDISNAFDGITYQKGAAVIGMFESYIGSSDFRKGVQNYLKEYAFRNATAPEFLDAISTSSKKNITKPFSTFLNQAGVPVVSASLECGQPSPTLHLEQQRSLPLGAKVERQQTWDIPVCIRFKDGTGDQSSCMMMEQPKQDMKLSAKSCPDWLQMNRDAIGYYQVDYRGDLFEKLTMDGVANTLSVPERVDFMGNARSAAGAGRLPLSNELKLVGLFHSDSDRHVIESALNIGLQPRQWVPAKLETNYQHFVETNFGPRAHEIGWTPRTGEDENVSLLRPGLVGDVAMYGGDKELAKQGRELAEKWLQNHSSVDPNLTSAVLQTAAYYGDKSLMDRYLGELQKTTDRQERQRLEIAMIYFRDPAAIEEGMRAVLSGEVPFIEVGGYLLVASGQSSDATRKMPLKFLEAHYDEVLAKRPTGGGFDFGSVLPRVGSSFCDAQSKEELKSFFEPRVDKLLGARRALDQTLEGIDDCIAYRSAQLPSLESFLQKY